MSSEASIITSICDLIELKRTLSELQAQYEEEKTMAASSGVRHRVDVVIKGPQGEDIGLTKTKKGDYQFIADTKGLTREQLKAQTSFINKIKQKYAYNKVVGELRKQGYVIAEEQKAQDNTIKLVARKWS